MKKPYIQRLIPWCYLMPNIAGFLVFTALPVVFAVSLTFFRWDVFHAPVFVGLENFYWLLGWSCREGQWVPNDPEFWQYLGNTAFLMLAIPLNMLVSLLIASLLNHSLKGISLFRTLFYLPTICGGVAVFLLWNYILAPEFGMLNRFLGWFGIDGPGWLTDYYWAKPALILMGLWSAMGGVNMLLYLAGLQGIPSDLYEAAALDGAGCFRRFWCITVPMLAPTNFFIFVMSVISGFQGGFDAAYVLTQGGPAGATTTLSYYIYNHAFVWFNMGYAATIAMVLFILVLAVTLINWKLGGRGHEA